MKHEGKATVAALKLVFWSLLLVAGVLALGIIAEYVARFIQTVQYLLPALWVVFALFCFYFFRDPKPLVPSDPGAIVSPAHGKIDFIGETEEPWLGGRCHRISMFLSPLDVHVQYAPVAARVTQVIHTPGKFSAAMSTATAQHNENVLITLDDLERPGQRLAVRLVAGVLARRIVPFVKPQEELARGDRMSLIQFGSRCELYLPLSATITVKVGDRVKGGETVVARDTVMKGA
ncbi:phosphatidylserine decarboxylase [Fontisphaera persica]|uniref:phosphatidylserine decarboxylase n=1 Tax=Fontisphaera persica TaxID=2974023 RepID=UPI0024C073ED|nr:phosphatidylserine decarboxylase [Fontisphaera persica]WCJ60270.1 phosphatidylserine decarboxylase [Fontisphaera persica]